MTNTRFIFFISAAVTFLNPFAGIASDDDTLKTSYVVSEYRSTVTFTQNPKASEGELPVKARVDYDVLVKRTDLKDYPVFNEVVFYNSFSSVKSIRLKRVKENSQGVSKDLWTEDHEYEENGIFHSDARYVYMRFEMTDMKSDYRLTYSKLYEDAKFFTLQPMTCNHPAERIVTEFIIPDWLDLELLEFNFPESGLTKTQTTDKSGNTVITFTNINGRNEREHFSFEPSYKFVEPHLVLNLKSANIGGQTKPLLNSTMDLYSWYYMLYESIDNSHNDALKAKVDELLESTKGDKQAIEAIYYWVQDNIRYIAFEDGLAGFRPDNCSAVYDKTYGDCKGMANLLTEMLKLAGYDAHVAWIGTRNNIPYTYDIPSLIVDNHMICALNWNDSTYFLDGTEKYVGFGENAHRIQGRPVLIENGPNDFILKTVPEQSFEHNKRLTEITARVDQENGRMNYEVDKTIEGEGKRSLAYAYAFTASEDKEKFADYLTNVSEHSSAELDTISIPNDRSLPISMSYSLELLEALTVTPEALYIAPDFEDYFSGFDELDARTQPWVFDEKINRIQNTSFEVPEGYREAYVPESFEIDNDEFRVSVSFASEGKTIKYSKEVTVFNGEISKSNMTAWHEAVNRLNALYNDRIILKKL